VARRSTPARKKRAREHEHEHEQATRPKSDHVRIAILGIGGAAAAFFMFGGLKAIRGRTGTSDPLDAVPKASFIAATVDFAELRRSPIYEAVLGKSKDGESTASDPLRRALGVGPLADACGFDPMSRVQRFALAVPEDGDRGEFGVAARVEVTREEIEKCTRTLAEKRGEKAETRDVGTFVVLEGGPSKSRLAYGRGGLLVVGKGTWFDAMLGAADRTKPGLRDAADHVALRIALTTREGFHAPTLIATAILPRTLRERLKGEMGAELGAQDTSSAVMGGVLGVASVGIAIHAGGPGQNVDASVELVCDSGEACEAVEKLAQKKRNEWSRDLTLRMVGLGPLLDTFEIKREGPRLRATASANADALAATVERIMKIRARRSAPDGPAPPTSPPERREKAGAKPDETLRSRP
jgi:hypothetical protein